MASLDLRPTVAALLISTVVLSACTGGTAVPAASAGGSATPAAKSGGQMVVSMLEDPDKLDPSLGGTAGGREVFINMCEKLYDLSADGTIVPQLASALPTFSSDGLTVTIPLRKNVQFNDSTPFDAAAVKTTLERHKTLAGSRRAAELGTVKEVSVVDASTVRLTLSAPLAPLVATLADRSGMIMSPTQLQKLGDNFGNQPVCVGPFSFVERVPGDRIVLDKSKVYYDADKVKLDRIIMKPILDGTVRTANLKSGDLQVVDRVQATDVAALQKDSSYKVSKVVSYGLLTLNLNVANVTGIGQPPGKPEPFSDPLIREAFDLSLDREQINTVVYAGLQLPGCTPLPPSSAFFIKDLKCPTRDIAKAKELIARSGKKTPIDVDFVVFPSPDGTRLGEVIQAQTKEAGFNVIVKPTEPNAGLQASIKGQFTMSQNPWSGRIDPDGNMYSFHISKGPDNLGNVSDPELDALLDKGRVTNDLEARKKVYADAVAKILARRSILYFAYQVLYAAVPTKVVGFEMFADGMPRMKTAAYLP